MIKFLLFFALINTTCFAQKIAVRNERQEPLQGVSIFLTGNGNTLIGVTDSLGMANLQIKRDSVYLFHFLGYDDIKVPAKQLSYALPVILKPTSYELQQVKVKKARYKTVNITNRPGNLSFGAENSNSATLQSVTFLRIEKPCFLKSFKLFAFRPVRDNMRMIRFIIFNAENGKPGSQIAIKPVKGELNSSRLSFDLQEFSPFLPAGDYFIGYESVSNSTQFYNNSPSKQVDKERGYPFTMIRGKVVKDARMYTRWNLKDWTASRATAQQRPNFIDLAYELEMDVVN